MACLLSVFSFRLNYVQENSDSFGQYTRGTKPNDLWPCLSEASCSKFGIAHPMEAIYWTPCKTNERANERTAASLGVNFVLKAPSWQDMF